MVKYRCSFSNNGGRNNKEQSLSKPNTPKDYQMFQVLGLLTYKIKQQQHLCKTDIGVLIVKRNMKGFRHQKR